MEKEIKRTERGDKIKLEDMTLADIKELKKNIQRAMMNAMRQVIEPYDVGEVAIYAETEVEEVPYYFESYGGHVTARSENCTKVYTYHIEIKFSKEDD